MVATALISPIVPKYLLELFYNRYLAGVMCLKVCSRLVTAQSGGDTWQLGPETPLPSPTLKKNKVLFYAVFYSKTGFYEMIKSHQAIALNNHRKL